MQKVGRGDGSFKPTVTLQYVTEKMNFKTVAASQEFLVSLGCQINRDKGLLMLKESKQAVGESKLLQGGFD